MLYVGDFCDGDAEDLKDLRKRLNGRIVLIKGNHDRLGDETYRAVFEDVVEEMRLDELNIRFIHIKEKIADRRPALVEGPESAFARGKETCLRLNHS